MFLCCISGEELGKCFISLSASVNRLVGRFNEKRYKQGFRTHREKTSSLNFLEDLFVSTTDLPIEPSKIEANTETTERVKLASLYCDFYGTEAHAPSDLIDERLARGALALAKTRVKHFNERVRPKFDYALKIAPEDIIKFQDEFLKSVGVEMEDDAEGDA